MRPYSIAGLVLIVLGIVAISIRSLTYFSTEQVVGPLGFFAWDVAKPHTIFINPVAGGAGLGGWSGTASGIPPIENDLATFFI